MKKVIYLLVVILILGLVSCAAEETIKIVEYGQPFCREDFTIYNSDGSIYEDPDNNEDKGYAIGFAHIYPSIQTARGLNSKSTIDDMLEAYKGIKAAKIQFAHDYGDTQHNVLPDIVKNESIRKGRAVSITFEYQGYTMDLDYDKNTLKTIHINSPQYNEDIQAQINAKLKEITRTAFDDYIEENEITLTAREVQYNMSNNVDNKFILEGVAELSDYYNYGFRDWSDNYFCLAVYPDDTYTNRWYIYCHRDSFEKVFDKVLDNKAVNVRMVCEISSSVYQKNQGNLARLQYIEY